MPDNDLTGFLLIGLVFVTADGLRVSPVLGNRGPYRT